MDTTDKTNPRSSPWRPGCSVESTLAMKGTRLDKRIQIHSKPEAAKS